MVPKKKPLNSPGQPVRTGKAIQLQTSTSDYETFVKATSQDLGDTRLVQRKNKPSMRVLSLMNLGS